MADEEILGEDQNTDSTDGKSVEDTGNKDAGTGDKDVADKSEDKSEEKSEEVKSEDTSDKSADEKSEDDKSSDDKSKEDEAAEGDKSDDKSESAPEEYADFDIPENVKVNEERLTSFTDFARTHDLSQKDAQSLVDLHLETAGEVAAQQQEQWDIIKKGWVKETKANKDLHDENGNADAAIAAAASAAKKLGGEEFAEALTLTGMGDHPSMVKVFHKISQAMAEDEFIFGSGSADTRTAAEKMYPSMKPKK